MQSAVARRYAAAIFELALSAGRLDEMDHQGKLVAQLYADRQVAEFLNSPKVSSQQKKDVLEHQLKPHLDQSMLNLLKLLVDKNRIRYVPEIMEYFDLLTNEHLGVEDLTLVSAVPLTDSQHEAIVGLLARFSDMEKLQVTTEVDGGVIGGVKVRLGENLVIDGTVSSRLAEMEQRLYKFRHKGTGA